MSGLKVYKMVDEKYCDDSFCVIPSDVYLKSEADEVIAELKNQVHEYAQGLYEIQSRTENEIRHGKYKRCLAMAKWCNERWILDDCLYELGKTRFYERWEKRWLKIAEQFKEDK